MTKDLEQNLREQDRITDEIAALQEQLATLQHDHATLLNMQQALGIAASAGGAVVPAPRTRSGGARRSDAKTAKTAKKPRTAKTAAGQTSAAKPTTEKTAARKTATGKTAGKKPAAGKTAAGKPEAAKSAAGKAVADQPAAVKAAPAKAAPAKATSQPAQPTLVELVRRYLAEQNEPRSAAEVAEALGRAHPDRGVQTKVVRTTLEHLVARNGAHRSKQGTSVFYTVPEEPAPQPAEATGTAE
ncbi:hypothetical protein [Streptomyces sp. NPDC017086]|uniref:hypothetical protein n=1 Tax=Streptomyces sp. NPDC017086 TaxID=3364976 RepID=UPI0037B361EF